MGADMEARERLATSSRDGDRNPFKLGGQDIPGLYRATGTRGVSRAITIERRMGREDGKVEDLAHATKSNETSIQASLKMTELVPVGIQDSGSIVGGVIIAPSVGEACSQVLPGSLQYQPDFGLS